MKKVVSIALFGDGDKYARYLSSFVRAHHNLFPRSEGWELRVHVDDAQHAAQTDGFLMRLWQAHLVEVKRMGSAALTKAMLWRMAPVFDPEVAFVFCRDLDAIPMPRDRACCEEFMRVAVEKKCSVHTIHDNLFHEGIMGGLCGFYANHFRAVTDWNSLEDLYTAAGNVDYAQHGVDQLVLNRLLLKAGGPRLFEHRFNGWHAGPGKHSPRKPGVYKCAGVSSPVPDRPGIECAPMAWRKSMNAHVLMSIADHLGNHLGCAGYDHEATVRFWEEYGDSNITAAIRACEAP